MLSIRTGLWETNSSTLHQFTICTDPIALGKYSECIFIRINDAIIHDEEFKATSIQDRFDVIMTYAFSDMIDSINDGVDAAEDWEKQSPDSLPQHLNYFNNTLEWIYNLQTKIMEYALIVNPMTKEQLKEYAYLLRDSYKCYSWRLMGSDMFSAYFNSSDQIMRWDISDVIKFIINDQSYYYQKNHTIWDPDEFPNNEHFYTVYSEE